MAVNKGAKEMSRAPIYEEIYAAWQKNPSLNQSELCRNKKVNVGTYMAWKRTHKGKSPAVAKKASSVPAIPITKSITITINIYDIVEMIQKEQGGLHISKGTLLGGLSDAQRSAVATALGMAQLNAGSDGETSDREEYSEKAEKMVLKT